MRIFRNQRGDTILEVLIAVAVLSLILTTAFVLANRSSQSNQQTAERGEAYKITQSEMELLKTKLSNVDARSLPPEGSYFCFLDNGDIYTFNGGPSAEDEATLSGAFYDLFDDNQAAADCRGGLGGYYHTYIYRGTAAEGQPNTFTAYTKWFAVTGNGIDKVELVHRIYPDEANFLRRVIGVTDDTTITQCNDKIDNDGDTLADIGVDPDCTSSLDNNEASEVELRVAINASADCYNGCPDMDVTYVWSQGSPDTASWPVTQLYPAASTYEVSYIKPLGTTLSQIIVKMRQDAYAPNPANGDRNLYVNYYDVNGTRYSYATSTTAGCYYHPTIYAKNTSRWQCGDQPMTYIPGTGIYLDIAGASYSNCSITNQGAGDGADLCQITGSSVFMRRNNLLEYSFGANLPGNTNADANITFYYQQYSAAGTTAPTGYNNFRVKVRVEGGAEKTINLPVSSGAAGYTQRSFTTNLDIPLSPGNKLYVEWVNNEGVDPDLQINKIEMRR